MSQNNHNAHMLIPKALWSAVGRIAKRERKHMTQLMCEGLSLVLATRKKQRKEISDDGKPDAQVP